MHKVLKLKWIYVICAVLLVGFAVTLIPNTFIQNFEIGALLTRVALDVMTVIIIALIVVFALIKLHKALKNRKK